MSKAGKIASLFGAGSTINPALVVVPAAVPPVQPTIVLNYVIKT